MATTAKPYRLTGDNSWDELLQQVNDVLQNPPQDGNCEALEPIQTPSGPHRWSRSNIEEVHNRLNEIPGDCFSFQPVPDKWKVSIIEDIESQLPNAWCDCDTECLEPCANAGDRQYIFLGQFQVDSHQCRNADDFEPGDCKPINKRFREALALYNQQRFLYEQRYIEACELEAELERLQRELETLQDQLARLEEQKAAACGADPPTSQCSSLTQQVADKQQEVSDKQDEIDETQNRLDTARAQRDGARGVYKGQITSLLSLHKAAMHDPSYTPAVTLVEGMSYPAPVASCADMPAECFGFLRSPLRCHVRWVLQSRFKQVKYACNGAGPFYQPLGRNGDFGDWRTVIGGHFDVDGTLVITNDGNQSDDCSPPLPKYFCLNLGSGCGKYKDTCGGFECFCLNCLNTTEYQAVIIYPDPDVPRKCNGQPCDDNSEPSEVG